LLEGTENKVTEEKFDDKPFLAVEQMPSFPGGEDALQIYLAKNIKYPQIAKDNSITGVVVLQFVVERDGNITDVKVLKPLGGGCEEEAKRVVKSMPNWKPGKQNGKAVPVYYTLPVRFI
jgi:periplasmic protein TonB